MKIIKKYTAIQLSTSNINEELVINLKYGDITGPYYSREYPEREFDTELEAQEHAFRTSRYSTWLILPITRFDIED